MSKTTVATIIVCVPIIVLLLFAWPQLAPVTAPSWMGWPP